MTPARYPLAIYRGDTYVWSFRLWMDSLRTIPLDLTAIAVKAQIRNAPGGDFIVDLALDVTLPNIITATLEAGVSSTLPLAGAWDLQLTYQDGSVFTPVAGPVTVTPDVTDSTPPAPRMVRLRA